MRFGKWRVATLAMTLAAVLGMGLGTTVRGDGWRLHSTLPGEVPAYDYTTGGEYFAPPVPYGHYAKDPHGQMAGHLNGLLGHLGGLFHHDGGAKGCGHGDGCGHGHGDGHGKGCGHGLGGGCGFCSGLGLLHGGKGGASACGDGNGGHSGLLGHGHKKHFAPCHASTVVATAQSQPSPQVLVAPSSQSLCGDPGCGMGGKHSHLSNLKNKLLCHLCGGKGLGMGGPCGGCGGSGLHQGHGNGCGNCGGKGCGSCLSGAKGLLSKAHGLLGLPLGMLHRNKIEWFVGPGGPVPLTPGYVPYIVTTRSPRDYFAFPPMNPDVP